MENSKIAEKHDAKEYKPTKKSKSLLAKEEENSKIIKGINLRPAFRFTSEFPERKKITKHFFFI